MNNESTQKAISIAEQCDYILSKSWSDGWYCCVLRMGHSGGHQGPYQTKPSPDQTGWREWEKNMEEDAQVGLLDTKAAMDFILIDLRASWKSAVRALNAAENAGLKDSVVNLQEIVAKLSQTLECMTSIVEA